MKKSTITCDMEGRILTMNDGAVQIFGYSREEIVGKKRVSLFSPGEIVLQNVAGWLDDAVKHGEYVGKTYFINIPCLCIHFIWYKRSSSCVLSWIVCPSNQCFMQIDCTTTFARHYC